MHLFNWLPQGWIIPSLIVYFSIWLLLTFVRTPSCQNKMSCRLIYSTLPEWFTHYWRKSGTADGGWDGYRQPFVSHYLWCWWVHLPAAVECWWRTQSYAVISVLGQPVPWMDFFLHVSLECTSAYAQAHARRAMDFLWEKRQRNSNLVGTTINIHSGEWVRRGKMWGRGCGGWKMRLVNDDAVRV